MKKEILTVLLLLLVSFPAVRSLLLPGGFTSHDLTHHVIRQISMDKLLSEGQFPPRWSGELNNGYGYPLFLFNYPLPALLGEVFHQFGLPAGRQGFGFVDSVKAVLFLSMVISVVGMYLFLKELLGFRLAAFLGAVFYLYAPLRFSNVYVSAAVGSALALGIVPFVFWALVEISKGNRQQATGNRWVLVGGLFLALLVLAHNVTALIFAPVILIFAWALVREIREIRVIREIGLMFLLGLGLSAWFWLPAIFGKQYIRFDEIYNGFFKDQFVSLWQLLRSPWGYGLSHPQNPQAGDMSYQLGLVQFLVMLILIPLVWVRREIREIRVIGGICLGLFVLSVFLMLKISLPVWDRLPFLSLVQFPLRFQAISIFSAAIAAALLVKYLPYKKFLLFSPEKGKLCLVFSLLLLVIYANRNHWNINEKFDPGDEYYLNLKTTSTTYGEHLPKWGRVMDRQSPGKLEFIEGLGPARLASESVAGGVIRDKSALVLADIETTTASKLRFNQFYFPGWEIEIDGNRAKFDYLTDNESYGLPVFDIQKGRHLVKAEFKNTTDRNLADAISVSSVILWLILLCKLLIRR